MTQATNNTKVQNIVAIKQATREQQTIAKMKSDNTVTVFYEKTDSALYFLRISCSNIFDDNGNCLVSLDDNGNYTNHKADNVKVRVRMVEYTTDSKTSYMVGNASYSIHDNNVIVAIGTHKTHESIPVIVEGTNKHAKHLVSSRAGYNVLLKQKYIDMIANMTQSTVDDIQTFNTSLNDIDDTDE